MTRAGLEPALPKETVLETVALDHSANESKTPGGTRTRNLQITWHQMCSIEVCRLIHWATGAIFDCYHQ